MRLDRFLRDALPELTNTERSKLLRDRRVAVDGHLVWLDSWKVDGAVVTLDGNVLGVQGVTPLALSSVLALDGDLLVVDKPTGVRPEPLRIGDVSDLTSMVCAAHGAGWVAAHRLDRDTSGVTVFTRPGATRREVVEAFARRDAVKTYRCVVASAEGLNDAGVISTRITSHDEHRDRMRTVLPGERGGDTAVTEYRVLDRGLGLVELRPQTGRTHQLRVHLASVAAPILGDRLYGDVTSAPRLMLHAYRLELLGHTFDAPLPDGFSDVGTDRPEQL
jgi:23S rRNA-/tRNA-specific pseudouridylate synthase